LAIDDGFVRFASLRLLLTDAARDAINLVLFVPRRAAAAARMVLLLRANIMLFWFFHFRNRVAEVTMMMMR